jgi:5-methyltetrahydrofolate--homocysteine methyltransferase
MAHVAREMEREGFQIPLLIGGATTSRVHTAVKIAPHYHAPVVWVADASRAVGVCSNLLSRDRSADYRTEVAAEYERIRVQHAAKQGSGPMHDLARARAHGFKADWQAYAPPKPKFIGRRELREYDLRELARYIDWGPFFQTWELSGSYPKILDDAIVGQHARELLQDAQAMLERIIEERWITAQGAFALYPANSIGAGDDIAIYADERREQPLMVWHNLRQQSVKAADRVNWCLADFVAPKSSGRADYIGAFAVTAGIGVEERVLEFERAHDDYNAILLKALADRLAEAFTERLHERVSKEFWGYAADEALSNEELIRERYRGIRPAPGYPACPDHTEKATLFELLEAPAVGITLTESFAMWPAAAVSGFYLSHPESTYFAVGKVGKDQVADYAVRKGMSLAEPELWLAPYLAYDP